MPPALIHFTSKGPLDAFLTVDPQMSLITNYTYHRFRPFAIHIEKVPLTKRLNFGVSTFAPIPKVGHLVSKVHLHIKLPKLNKNGGEYIAWSDILGFTIFDGPIELEIGGVVIDRIYPQQIDLGDELKNINDNQGKNLMILKSDISRASRFNADRETDLMIPIEFYFTKHYSMALPIYSIYNQEAKIKFKFRSFDKIINYDGALPTETPSILDANMYIEYIFLDDGINELFKNKKHRYVIEQTQFNEIEFIKENETVYNATLSFNNMVKELQFALVEKENVDNNNYFVYEDSNGDGYLKEIAFYTNGQQRFQFLPESYYRLVFPSTAHRGIPIKHIYSIPFGIELDNEEKQPIGGLNFSGGLSDQVLSFRLKSGNPDLYLYVYAINYNILTIQNGNIALLVNE